MQSVAVLSAQAGTDILLLTGSEFYKLELQSDGTGTAGVNWDKLAITTGINNDTLINEGATPVTLKLQTLTGLGANGALASWDGNTNHVWTDILTTTGGWSVAFSPSQFTIDTSGFANSFIGTFSVVDNGAGLNLVYTVPEPSVGLSLLLGSGLLASFRRRRP